MIALNFKSDTLGRSHRLVAGRFRVSSNFMRDADSGQVLGRYLHHYWEVQGEHFTRYEAAQSVAIHFEDLEGGRTDQQGPFASFHVADGSVYADGKLAAKFVDQTLMWHDHQSDTYWPVMIIAAP